MAAPAVTEPTARSRRPAPGWSRWLCTKPAFGGLAFWALRLVLDVPGTVAGFRRWVLAVAPVAPGVRAGLPADGGSRALPAGERDTAAKREKDQDAERLPRDVAGQHEPRAQAEPSAPDTPNPHEISGVTQRSR